MTDEQTVVVINKRASGVMLLKTMLLPGENDVPKAEIEEGIAHKNGVIKGWFDEDSGILSIKKGAKKAKKLADNLSKLSPERAQEIIGKCDRVDELMKWAQDEKRSEVNQAITARLQELKRSAEGEPDATGLTDQGAQGG